MEDNQNLERFMRRGLSERHFPFVEGDWNQLAGRLDAEGRPMVLMPS